MHLAWLRDSLFQYKLMSIQDDYKRIVDSGDHLEREEMRHQILLQRLKDCIQSFHSCIYSISLDESVIVIKEGMVRLQDLITRQICKCNSYFFLIKQLNRLIQCVNSK